MDELQAGIEYAFAVFPETAALFKPGKRAFHHPTFGHDGKGVEVTAFGNLHGRAKGVGDGLGKRFSDIAAIGQQAANPLKVGAATSESFQGAFTIGHLGGAFLRSLQVGPSPSLPICREFLHRAWKAGKDSGLKPSRCGQVSNGWKTSWRHDPT